MHDCAWAANPSFEIATYLLQRDSNFLYLFDARGSLPLSYVTKPLWGEWNTFLSNSLDSHFPKDNPHKDKVPILCTMKPNSRPVPDPKNKIAPQLAKAVAMGEMSPYEAIVNQGTDDDTYLCSEIDSDDSSYYSDDDSDFDSDEEEELYQIVGQIGNMNLNTIQEYWLDKSSIACYEASNTRPLPSGSSIFGQKAKRIHKIRVHEHNLLFITIDSEFTLRRRQQAYASFLADYQAFRH